MSAAGQLTLGNRSTPERRDFTRRLGRFGARQGLASAGSLVRRPPPWARSWAVYGLVSAVPSVGSSFAYDILREAGIPASTLIGDIDDRQRVALDQLLAGLAMAVAS